LPPAPRASLVEAGALPLSPALNRANDWIRMNMHLGLTPLLSLLAGILILVMPRLLNYIVAIYLIVIGLIGLFGGAFKLG
jgi:hypothetical protein